MISRFLKRFGIYALAFVVTVFTLFPFYWIIVTSFKTRSEIFSVNPSLLPGSLTFENYIRAFTENDIARFFMNSLYVVLVSVTVAVVAASLAAYALSRFEFPGKRAVSSILFSTQVFPVIVILVPLYMLTRYFGIFNTHTAIIIPYIATQVTICTILLINYFAAVPNELVEASTIDGCNRMQSLWHVILPLVTPGLASSAIYCFINLWQEFLLASTFINRKELYTLTVGLGTFRGQHATDWGGLMAASVVIALPSLILFALASDYFINNMAGGVKE
jgi:ABC-type glycerol-3-phosphate transport system permease component